MADAILSAAAGRIAGLIEAQARYQVNLVRGVEKEVHSLAKELMTIKNVLDDAENRRFKDTNINYWLSRLEQASYEMEDVLDEWDYDLLKLEKGENQCDDNVFDSLEQKVCFFIPSFLCFKKVVVRHKIANKILNVKAQVDEILRERDRYGFVISQYPLLESWRIQSTSLIDLGKVQGRDRDRDIVVGKLMDNDGSQEESNIHIVSIVGAAGLGKTTLARLVYNDSRVEEAFELKVWVCVSDPFDLAAIAKGILECIKVGSSPKTDFLEVLFKQVKESISGKKFFLTLDDVWEEDSNKWESLENCLKCGGAGSKILVTTRNERVAKMMGSRDSEIYRPTLLSDKDCWLLLCGIALSGRNKVEFEDIGKKIAKKCYGLPLAIKTMGSLLRFKSRLEEWKNVFNSEIWKMKEVEVDIFPHLLLSYNELSSTLKRCFSYCAVFPKDSKIFLETLIEDWMALGYLGSNIDEMELKGREFFDVLAMRSLFQDFEKFHDLDEVQSFKMHDIVHDFAQFVRRNGRVELEPARMNKTTCRACDPLLVSTVNQFCSLYCERETPPTLCDCLVRLRVLSLTEYGLQSIPQGIEKLIHLRKLRLFGIVQLSCEELKIIFHLYNLQTLSLEICNLEEIPREIENLIHLKHLDLCGNESLKKLPREIGNLIYLRRLDLSYNKSLEELPDEIGNLIRLRYLNLMSSRSLKELPESICALRVLKYLNNDRCKGLCILPQGLTQLTDLRSLGEFRGGSGWSKFGLLKSLNHLSGTLDLKIRLATDDDFEEIVEDARKARLKNKIHIEEIVMTFKDEMDENESSSPQVRMCLIEALEPHPSLQSLSIRFYKGVKLPLWMISPLNQLRKVSLYYCSHLSTLPSLGKLPCLEEIFMYKMEVLEIVGREFLGITTTTRGDIFDIAFPKLKKMTFEECVKWKEWEDITVKEEECATFTVMPCLAMLRIRGCHSLTELPHRLLRKASSLEMLNISKSSVLQQRYMEKDEFESRLFQNNPRF